MANKKSEEELFNDYLQDEWYPTIHKLALQHSKNTNMHPEDLHAWGVHALYRAIKNWDPKRNPDFNNYATSTIMGQFKQANLKNQAIPNYIYQKHIKPLRDQKQKGTASEVRDVPVEEYESDKQSSSPKLPSSSPDQPPALPPTTKEPKATKQVELTPEKQGSIDKQSKITEEHIKKP